MKEKLLRMMKDLIDGKYDCNDFSYDFPFAMFGLKEIDSVLLDQLDDMPEICAAYEQFKTPDEVEFYNDSELIAKVKEIYDSLVKS